jgi:hypothetical protein
MKSFLPKHLFFASLLLAACNQNASNQPANNAQDSATPRMADSSVNKNVAAASDTMPSGLATKDSLVKLNWHVDLCENTGSYNARLHTEKELLNTLALWDNYTGQALEDDSRPGIGPDKPLSMDVAQLSTDFAARKKKIAELDLVNDPFWETLRNKILLAYDDRLEADKLNIQAFTDPSVLQNSRFSANCAGVVAALTANDTSLLLAEWKKQVTQKGKKDGTLTASIKAYETDCKSDKKLEKAKRYLISTAWRNSANTIIRQVAKEPAFEQKFNSLFTKLETVCEEYGDEVN